MQLEGYPVTVIGAGIGGLAAACALAQKGANVRVIERAPEITEVGAGIQISENGAKVLRGLGLEAAATDKAMASAAVHLRDYKAGDSVLRIDLSGRGAFWLFHRADLIGLLEDRARELGVKIQLGSAVSEIALGPPRLRFDAESPEVPTEGLLIGADGLHSRLRARLLGPAAPRFTGQVAWRAILPLDAGAPVPPTEAQIFMAPGRHIVAYPLRQGRFMNLVCVEEREAWAAEGWSHAGDADALREVFGDFGGPIPGWLERVEHIHLWGLFRHPVAARWYEEEAVLLGDAAHPTLPFLAQGACLALEDAWRLALELERCESVEQALRRYEGVRRKRAERVVTASTSNAWKYHVRFAPARWVGHTALRLLGRAAPNAVAGQFDWLYGYDPGA